MILKKVCGCVNESWSQYKTQGCISVSRLLVRSRNFFTTITTTQRDINRTGTKSFIRTTTVGDPLRSKRKLPFPIEQYYVVLNILYRQQNLELQENGSEKNDIPTHIRFRYILIGSLDILIGADSFVDVDNWRYFMI